MARKRNQEQEDEFYIEEPTEDLSDDQSEDLMDEEFEDGYEAVDSSNKLVKVLLALLLAIVIALSAVIGFSLAVKSCNKTGVNNSQTDNSGGDTSGGDSSGGDTSGGDSSGGDSSGGDSSGGDTSGGDSSGGDSSGGDSSGGDSSGGDSSGGDSSGGNPSDTPLTEFVNDYKGTTKVGYSGKQTGTTKRVKPVSEIKNEGMSSVGYPEYGKNMSSVIGTSDDKVALRNAIIQEASYLTSSDTWNGGGGNYKWIDKNGYLYNGTTAEPVAFFDSAGHHRQLYKHTASVGLYGGNVSDSEPGIIKKVTLSPRGYSSYSVTGVYAPAGEVIKIELSEKDMNATGGITVHIGQALYNGKANNIWAAKNDMSRMPIILNTLVINKDTATLKNGVYTAYVGSYLGGPLYIRNTTATFTATISGGVAYSHFILGSTTKEEFEKNAKSSAPYFDLEVWEYGVLHSGPKTYAESFSYDDLYKAAILWEKVALVSTTGAEQGIVMIYDPFVAAGAAVAFPGQYSVNCPADWMDDSLNYSSVITQGAWGNFHEFHHNFQGYGVGGGGEVTNNGMTLVSYSLFTKVSSLRRVADFGAAGMSGWNRYTSPTFALEQTLKIARQNESPENGNNGLALYATLLHNFGTDEYIQAKYTQRKNGYGENYLGYLRAWQDITHNDMSYFFNTLLDAGISSEDLAKYANSDYPMFVPVSSVYQTGRSYFYDGKKKYITTAQPYVIPVGKDFVLDLGKYTVSNGMYQNGSIVLPDGFTFTIKNISTPEHGSLEKTGDYTYLYKPDGKNLSSGKIFVTLSLTATDGAIKFTPADVELVIELEQSNETNKGILQRTTYTYEAGSAYTDAIEAYTNAYANYSVKKEEDASNPTQNCNTDIWYTTDAPVNSVVETYGKLYIKEAGKYRLFLRGRNNCAVYYSLDDNDYFLGGKITEYINNSQYFRTDDPNTYIDLELSSRTWVYFKSVLVVQTYPRTSYIGLGLAQWTTPMFTTRTENGVTHYYDANGNEVTEAEVNAAKPVAPTITTSNQPYVNGYRASYEFPEGEYEADYFYTRKYKYTYSDNIHSNAEQTLVSTNYEAKMSWNFNDFKTEYVADGDKNTYIHTKDGYGCSAEKPVEFVLDMGKEMPANKMIIYSQNRPNGDWHVPKDFTLFGSLDGEEFFTVGEFTDVPRTGITAVVEFEEKTFRYYKLVVTGSTSTNIIIIGEIELIRQFELTGEHISPDSDNLKFEGTWKLEQPTSTFGHVYVGKEKDILSFEFEGKRLGILSSSVYGKNFEVYIDGVKVDGIALKEDSSDVAVSFISGILSEGKHKVEIKCIGEANIDSVVIFS